MINSKQRHFPIPYDPFKHGSPWLYYWPELRMLYPDPYEAGEWGMPGPHSVYRFEEDTEEDAMRLDVLAYCKGYMNMSSYERQQLR